MRYIYLTDVFYAAHANRNEILTKSTRPYVCLEITIEGVTFAIPLRHNIQHKYAFITRGAAGLDYTKAVVISDPAQVSAVKPQIEQADFNALKGKERRIHRDLVNYITLYKKAFKYRTNPHYANILKYSTLKYFHQYLRLI